MKQKFRSSGKLLLSGEYAILDGAMGLAVPTKKGQSLLVTASKASGLRWISRDCDGNTWFSTEITWPELNSHSPHKSETTVRSRLILLLQEARKLNADFLSDSDGYSVETELDFPRKWGLGTSSSLIHSLAKWSETDPFELQKRTLGGSGYDIACAGASGPILFQLVNGEPSIKEVSFFPSFSPSLYFVYLNRKQDSGKAIEYYRNREKSNRRFLDKVTNLTRQIASSKDLDTFEKLLQEHESLLSSVLGQPTVKERYFSDYKGSIKSLGAWGGDFILVCGTPDTQAYFEKKGYTTIVPYGEMVV